MALKSPLKSPQKLPLKLPRKENTSSQSDPLPETLKALAKVMSEVEMGRTDPAVSEEERLLLNRLSLQLRQTERDLLKKANADWVKAWKSHQAQLQGLTTEIRSAGRRLSGLTARLERINVLLRDLLKVERGLLSEE